MPKVSQKYIKNGSLIGLWHISETADELRSQLKFTPAQTFKVEARMQQWLASRVLLEEMMAEFGLPHTCQLEKRGDGRPILSDTNLHVSISHAGHYAAVAISQEAIGLDIEKIGNRIERIRHKFMNDEDLAGLSNDHDIQWMHTVWSAKEALFKFDERENIDFKDHLHLSKLSEGLLAAEIRKDNSLTQVQVPYEFFDGYVMAWAIQ